MDLSMDFIEGLPKSEGYTVIMVVVDRLTKFAHFVAVKHPYTASSIAHLFMDNVVKLHGLPNSIVTDRDTIFVSQFLKELFKLYRVNMKLITAYHPLLVAEFSLLLVVEFLLSSREDDTRSWGNFLVFFQMPYPPEGLGIHIYRLLASQAYAKMLV